MLQDSKKNDILVKNIWSNQTLDFEGLKLKYKIEDFECGIQAMNSDFQEILKADEYPNLFLQLNSIKLYPGNSTFEELNVISEVEIVLAGTKKKIKVSDCKVFNHSEAHLTLTGSDKMLMTDFGIDPPVKFLGMVKVRDEITIEFEIEMIVSEIK